MEISTAKKKIAIVYDWLDKWGGVERVLLTLSEVFPSADFYTSYWDKENTSWFQKLKIKTSFINNLPSFIKRNRFLSFLFYPYAFEAFDFSKYRLVISVTSSFAKAIITKPGTAHICYLLTPTRYLWVCPKNYFKNHMIYSLLRPCLHQIKNWDFVAAQRPDKMISISQTVADRCRKNYQRESEVIYPPFDIEYWNKIKSQITNDKSQINFIPIQSGSNFKFFLVVSRLEQYKKVELVIQSFNRLNQNLIIVGDGSQEKKLRLMAGKNVRFYNKLTDEELGYLYSQAQALIMPQEEDFGYVSLEAQFFSCPVITYKKGGATETVIDGKTGIFFAKQDERSLLSALERFREKSYNIRTGTGRFGPESVKRFEKKIFIDKFEHIISNL